MIQFSIDMEWIDYGNKYIVEIYSMQHKRKQNKINPDT